MMQTREAPDFWRLHKNMNCVFALISMTIETTLNSCSFQFKVNQSVYIADRTYRI